MRRLLLAVLPLIALCVTACATAAQTAEPALRQLLADGKITQEQFDQLMLALQNAGGEDVWSIVAKIGGVLAAIVLPIFGVVKAPTMLRSLKAPPKP